MGAAKGADNRQQAFVIIAELSAQYSVSLLCRLAGVSRSGYYKWYERQWKMTTRQRENEWLKTRIIVCRKQTRGIYGYLRTRAWLVKTYGIRVNHKRVYRFMKELGISSVIRRKKRNYGLKEAFVITDNKLNREFQATRPLEKWVTDITFLPFGSSFLYLSTIFDLYNNEVVAYKLSKRNDLRLVLDTVKKAIRKRKTRGILLHSDRGFQYTSRAYNFLLKRHGIQASMSRKGNCLDNACIESFIGHLKCKSLRIRKFTSPKELRDEIHRYIHFYNHKCLQKKLNNLSPVDYRTKVA
ncbi:integrase [Brevibacillus choshinensis]|uniref:Integrase n=1 Tax=Brevibacillus choshinensis TaxID=54911 RepID=A0ABR5N6C5_BRECH|nr:IS3 family transposase [Brevibacillus choshinensis]KQL45974.1 integrase [Brevibacillus choshinensis]